MGRTSNAKQRLVESARDLIHEKGYTAVGVAEICNRADVNKGSFYYFFPSKHELALAVIGEFQQAASPLFEELVADDLPPLERLTRFFDSSYRAHQACRREHGCIRGCALGNLALELSTQDDQVRNRLREVFDFQVGCFEKLVADALSRGDVPPLDPRRAAQSLVALIEGGVMMAKMHNDPKLLRDLEDDAMRLLGISP